MKYVQLPVADEVRRLSFYLAMEEYVARYIDEPDCFFMWQVNPSVIFGRNQVVEAEVNLDFCRKHGIETYRRKSGGGCVYADLSNVMLSYITNEHNVNFTFNRYIMMIVHVLQQLGVDARSTGRNDVMVDDRKVSGNAFYLLPRRSVVHGTLLYDTNMDNMVGSITPADAKLLSKGVQSVHQRVALLKDYITLTLPELKQFIRTSLCDGTIELSQTDVHAIEELEQSYLSPSFIYGNNPSYAIVKKRHIDNVGDLEARIEMKNGAIKRVNLLGDYFLISDQDSQLLDKLKGLPLEHEALSRALPDRIDHVIMNLQKEDFIYLLIQ